MVPTTKQNRQQCREFSFLFLCGNAATNVITTCETLADSVRCCIPDSLLVFVFDLFSVADFAFVDP